MLINLNSGKVHNPTLSGGKQGH